MYGSQPESRCGDPISLGIELFAPISSVAGSSSLFITQPLLAGKVCASSAVIIGAEFIIFIAHRFFNVKSIPILDLKNERTVQIPISELQEFLKWMANGSGSSPGLNTTADGRNRLVNLDGGLIDEVGERGFLTPESPEAPLILAIYVLANYSDKLYTPYVLLTIPILTFPGVRGALPLLIIGLLATIFVRAVVPPETTGAKPLVKANTLTNGNTPLTFTPNDLLKLLTRFGKHFGSD
ncbi:hypothetical protein [Desulfosporosinus lacus]|uniref:Uncharacterized protein n=1 Tax=Desulfosporosinus lacus DSM 15449 TaxID=1121420 RepID=A0A1M5W873_9FIRM|nr:hypothetical protein [Desulfosporosinus lacus]SHH83789.1 hypothetical protein SAMN02746098_01499 [Desulfosporosinus lacus DSM 15449]